MLPRISIIIPSYNKAEFVEETLISIISQKYSNLEIIIQDGASTDGTLEIIKKYAKKYPKLIKWESKKDEGQTDAINKGFKKATGEVCSFINGDDLYKKGALESVGKYFQEHPGTLWLAGKGNIIDEKGREKAELITKYKDWLLKKNDYRFLLVVNYLMQPSVFLSRKAYIKYGLFTGIGKWVMEYETWLKIGKDSMPKVIKRSLSGFRLTKNNVSMTNFKKILKADDDIAEKYTDNLVILGLHWLHNIARIIIAYSTNA